MSRTRAYRCLNCLEHTIDREFDTSHLSVTCPNCESFERFVNEAVFQQFEAFEASPPSEFDWNRLDRMEKLVVAERLVRSTKTLDDFEVVDGETAASNGDPDGDSGDPNEDSGEVAEESGEVAEADGETADTHGESADGDDASDSSTSEVVPKGTAGETA